MKPPHVYANVIQYTFFLRTYFYSCHSLLLLRVWNKAVGRDGISYSWKFLVQSPSLKHAMGLPMWIMYGEKETQWGRSMEVKPITLWIFYFFLYKNFTIITRECGFVGGFVSSLWAHIHPVSIVLYPLCCSTGKKSIQVPCLFLHDQDSRENLFQTGQLLWFLSFTEAFIKINLQTCATCDLWV